MDSASGAVYVPVIGQYRSGVGRCISIKEDMLVATLRSSRRLGSWVFIACVAACQMAVSGMAADPADTRRVPQPPRTLMRLPGWIESMDAARPANPGPSAADTRRPKTFGMRLVGGWAELADKADEPTTEPAAQPSTETVTEPASLPAVEPVSQQPAQPSAKPAATTAAAAPAALPPSPPVRESLAPPVAAPPSDTPTLSIDPASFRNAHPGKTTRAELFEGWGPGEEFVREDGAKGFFWKVDPFERVEVVLADDVIESIRIKLGDPVAVKELAGQLDIANLRTVSILDDAGVSIGEVYPERGVVITVKPGTQSATAVLLEAIDAEAFVLRAEGDLDDNPAYAVADLQYAIQIDPKHVRAHRLLLVLLSEQGCWDQAAAIAATVESLDPSDVWTQLKHASVLLTLGRTDEARSKVEAVKSQKDVAPLVTAQAVRMLGRIELASRKPDYQKAVGHFEAAIRTAAPLAANESPEIQKAARDVLLDAHLGTALSIAKGTWQQKGRVIPKWIARSEALVAEVDAKDADRVGMEMHLCRGVLAAAAGSAEGVEPLPWVKRLLSTREKLDETVKDERERRQIDWEVGLALADALTASLLRGDAADMLENATLTAAYLERGSEQRQLTARERHDVGDLMFRIGVLHSLQKGDHPTAVTWFDKSVSLWSDSTGFDDADLGRLGESFVSMAISYWQVNRREDALKLSRKGVDMMVEAVDRKQLDERALAVAYGNLSTMYAEQGDDEQSKNYAEMASRAEATGTVIR